jgi:hypothetical protein
VRETSGTDLINAKVEETFKIRRPLPQAAMTGRRCETSHAGNYNLACRYYFDFAGAVGPVAEPPDPPAVLAPGAAGLLGPVEAPAEPPVLLLPNPGELLPTEPGTPCGAPTAPPLDVPVVCAPALDRHAATSTAPAMVTLRKRITQPSLPGDDHHRCEPYQSSMSLRT